MIEAPSPPTQRRSFAFRAAIVIVVSALVVYLFGTLAFGWRPGDLVRRPSQDDCVTALSRGPGMASTVHVSWIWAAKGFGWGCRATYSDGSTATATSVSGLASRDD